MTTARILMDCVNGWVGEDWAAAGFKVFRLGVNPKGDDPANDLMGTR